ncbi:selenium cofactor biosynthesis protein YqeC [Aquisalimonas sp.]|uniref:selenium cofactor biosynthesis protein YqeC n=1 Tax=Aquisalimonas sp. TaxID=1872621 RepID=UPI0025BF103E|nr:selenium cofactor biosynthesis protein YqeC [Aquisalimonas sp.]
MNIEPLLEALGIREGIVCAVGAGGKKTLLYHLLQHYPGRTAMTTTVFTYQPPPRLEATVVVDDETQLRTLVPQHAAPRILYAQPTDKAGRLAGVSAETLAGIHADGGFGLTAVKADGARMRLIKAPRDDEPRIPAYADTALLVGSVHALARPVNDRIAHRLDQVLAITELAEGQLLTPAAMARLYTHPHGLLQGTGSATPVPVLNMVDSGVAREAAETTARHILDGSDRFDRVVLTSLKAPGLLVDVIRRQ